MRNSAEQGRARLLTIATVAASLRKESDHAATADRVPARAVVTGKFARRMLRAHGVRKHSVRHVSGLLRQIATA